MAKQSPMRQVNVRLSQESFDVIRASAFLDDASEAELVRKIVERYVTSASNDSDVQNALKLLNDKRHRSIRNVSDLTNRDRTSS